MGYLLAFGVIWFGYTVLDWGHFTQRHERINLWWLMTGMGDKQGKPLGTSSASGASGLVPGSPAANAGGGDQPQPGGGSW